MKKAKRKKQKPNVKVQGSRPKADQPMAEEMGKQNWSVGLVEWLKRNWVEVGFEAAVLIVFIIYGLMVWWPTRYLPSYWDNATLVIDGARGLWQRNFSPLVLLEIGSSHPPLLQIMMALIWKALGITRLTTHLVMLPALPLLMWGTYLIAKKTDGRLVGLIAAFLVGMMPAVVAGVGTLSADLVAVGLAVLGLGLVEHKLKIPGWLFITAAVWVKTTSLLILVWFLWKAWTTKQKKSDVVWVVAPVLAALAWFGYHLQTTGWLTAPPGGQLILPTDIGQWLAYLGYVGTTFLTSHMKWLITLIIGAGFILLTQKKKLNWPDYQLEWGLLITVVVALGYLALRGNYQEFFSLIVMPLWIILSLRLTKKVLGEFNWVEVNKGLVGVGVIISLGLLMAWQPKVQPATGYNFRQSADLSYQDMILVGRQAAAYLETTYPRAKIYGGYPENYQLTQPHQGFVTGRLDFSPCSEYQETKDTDVVVYLHPYHPSQQDCRVLMDKAALKPMQRYDSNGIWVELFVKEATPAAEVK